VAQLREDTMGMFIEADHHPFHEADREMVVEDARGGMGGEAWRDERGMHEYVRPTERPRGLYISDESLS
jgi:hypothetical protein